MRNTRSRSLKYNSIQTFVFTIMVLLSFFGTACAKNIEAVDISGPCPQDRKTAQAPKSLYSKTNPVPPTAENFKLGKQLYQEKAKPIACKYCHGEKGNGMGDPDFESTPAARNFTCKETMNKIPDGQLFWVIRNGSPNTAMPLFSDLSDEQTWQLVHYIRQFSQ